MIAGGRPVSLRRLAENKQRRFILLATAASGRDKIEKEGGAITLPICILSPPQKATQVHARLLLPTTHADPTCPQGCRGAELPHDLH